MKIATEPATDSPMAPALIATPHTIDRHVRALASLI